jgi:hypothetical protein
MLVFVRSFVAVIVVTALAWIAAGPACGQDSHYCRGAVAQPAAPRQFQN